jgi:hypothetical protein
MTRRAAQLVDRGEIVREQDEIDFLRISFCAPPVTFCLNEVPEGLVTHVRSGCRKEWVVERVLVRLAEKVLRRLDGDIDTEENRRRRWASAWSPAGQPRTVRRINRFRNQVLRDLHLQSVSTHEVPQKLPRFLLPWRPNAAGQLVIDDPHITSPSIGSPPYMEQTPPKVYRWLHETWRARRVLDEEGEDIGLEDNTKPKVWDLTAGSGTALDYFSLLCGCDVASTDLTTADHRSVMADCRTVGEIPEHGRPYRFHLKIRAGVVIPSPDLILFDPPSMGTPSHAAHYGEVVNPHDLSFLDRYRWLFTIAKIVERATRCLAEDGLLSLFLRLGERDGSSIKEDPALLADFKDVLSDRALIVHEMPILYRRVRAQASLGEARVPAVHLTLMRAP